VGALLGVRMAGSAWLNMLVGWNAFRRYKLEGGPNDGNYDPERGLVIRGGIEIRLPGN
jgi:hypothetical protein